MPVNSYMVGPLREDFYVVRRAAVVMAPDPRTVCVLYTPQDRILGRCRMGERMCERERQYEGEGVMAVAVSSVACYVAEEDEFFRYGIFGM